MEWMNRLPANTARLTWLALLAIALCLSLAACGTESALTPTPPAATGGSTEATATQPAASTDGSSAQEVNVTLTEWAVKPAQTELQAGKVKLLVTNEGKFTHNLTILQGDNQLGKTPNFKSDEGTKTLEVDLQPGTYQFICSISGHPEQGMKTEVMVK